MTGCDKGQEPLVTEMAFCVRECVFYVQCQGPLQLAESLYASDLQAARLSRRGSAAPLQIITPPPDTQRHFKSTPPSPRLCTSFISLDREEIQLFFFFLTSSLFLSLSLSHTKTLHSSLGFPYTVHAFHTEYPLLSLKTGLITQISLFLPPPAIIYSSSSSHCISDKYLHGGSFGGPLSGMQQDRPLAAGYCEGRGL